MSFVLSTLLTLLIMSNQNTATATRFEVRKLPYAADALAPALSEETLRYHYGKHYTGYVAKLNELVAGTPCAGMTLEQLVREAEGAVYNNAAQAWNHEFYFESLSPAAQQAPSGPLKEAVDRSFGSFEALKAQLTQACAGLFGSGWVWLVEEPGGRLAVVSESNAGNPLRYGMKPLLAIDVWEHAYYIDYRNARADAIAALWPFVDWKIVGQRYEAGK